MVLLLQEPVNNFIIFNLTIYHGSGAYLDMRLRAISNSETSVFRTSDRIFKWCSFLSKTTPCCTSHFVASSMRLYSGESVSSTLISLNALKLNVVNSWCFRILSKNSPKTLQITFECSFGKPSCCNSRSNISWGTQYRAALQIMYFNAAIEDFAEFLSNWFAANIEATTSSLKY